jgi:transcription initiation factor TFIIIB Brf1 subunit/transcription initiation factor TFIIB
MLVGLNLVFYNKNPSFRYHSLKRYDSQAKLDSKQKSRNNAFRILRILANTVGINSNYDKIIEESEKFYNKALRYDLVRGRSIELAVIVSLYHGCQLYNYPISIEAILEKSDNKYEVKQVRRYHSKIIRKFDYNIPIHTDLEQIARRTMDKIEGLRHDIYRNILSKVKIVEGNNIHLGNPTVLIAALIYLVAKEGNNKITQITMCSITGISQKSLSLKCKYIRQSGFEK